MATPKLHTPISLILDPNIRRQIERIRRREDRRRTEVLRDLIELGLKHYGQSAPDGAGPVST